MFDREHVKRTHVHDAQADYYESSTWLSEEEKLSIDEKMKSNRDSKQPSNRKYKMTFDIAGRYYTILLIILYYTILYYTVLYDEFIIDIDITHLQILHSTAILLCSIL